jgi:molybdopterin converting factor small subunit
MSKPIRFEVRLYASLEKVRPRLKAGEPFFVELESGTTARHLVETLGIATKRVQLIFVNGVVREFEHVLAEGDRVAFFPAIGGG